LPVLLLSCFLLYFGFARLLWNPFLLFGLLLYHSRSIPFHTTPFELNERARRTRWCLVPGGARGVCLPFFFFSIRFFMSLQIHLHYEVVFVWFFFFGLGSVMHDISCRHTRWASLLSRRLSLLSSNTFLIQDLSEVPGGLLPFLLLFSCVGVC
jgi:hypothetical protein